MRKKSFFMKLVAFLCVFTIIISGGSLQAFATSQNNDKDLSIKETVESFFEDYENSFDKDVIDSSIYSDYFVSENNHNTKLNIAIIDTMLYRRIVINQEYNGNLSELNKNLTFNYNCIKANDNVADIDVTVTKTFNYESYLDVESATRDNYSISLKKEEDSWKIVEIENFVDDIIKVQLDDSNVNLESIESINNYRDGILDNIQSYFSDTSSSVLKLTATSPTRSTTYNGSGAATYALNHALDYNNNYADFNGYGGDCTNFVSQCIFEGGNLPMHYGSAYTNTCWYYTNSTNRSSSWTGVEELYDYIFGSTSKINASHSNWSSVGSGDIIQLVSGGEGYHSLIITGVAYSSYGRSDLLVCAHTNDRRHVSLASYYSGSTKRYIDITSSDL